MEVLSTGKSLHLSWVHIYQQKYINIQWKLVLVCVSEINYLILKRHDVLQQHLLITWNANLLKLVLTLMHITMINENIAKKRSILFSSYFIH